MSIWLELRCNWAHLPCAEPTYSSAHVKEECYSYQNATPGLMAKATKLSLIETYDLLSKEAEKEGWQRIRKEWVCPHCLKHRDKNSQNRH